MDNMCENCKKFKKEKCARCKLIKCPRCNIIKPRKEYVDCVVCDDCDKEFEENWLKNHPYGNRGFN